MLASPRAAALGPRLTRRTIVTTVDSESDMQTALQNHGLVTLCAHPAKPPSLTHSADDVIHL